MKAQKWPSEMMNFDNTKKKTQPFRKLATKMKFVSFFSSKKWCVGWYCWAVLENLMLFWHGPCPSLENIGVNPSLQLQVDKISSSRRVFLFKRCKRLQRQENGWHFASALS